MEIWNKILQSNAFNFIIMLLMFIWLGRKVNFSQIMESVRTKVIETLEKAKQEKEDAQRTLKEVEKSVENLESELEEKLRNAKHQGEMLSQKILEDTKEKVKELDAGIIRIISTEEKTISSRLTKNTAKESVVLAKQQIIEKLKMTPELHKKYIEESIQELSK